ncbi:MAG TPA: phenylalanine--tRNA ligase subunit beta [Solirubrobacteraceae bacterium]|nr:phenylalanine--tRNA ligase subunit beta [Solirubrobacteraceae bacterium]
MRVPLSWLHEYCAPDLDAAALAERLAMTGTEVERVERHGVEALDHFVIGRVLERHRHPDADRLNVCMVNVGGSTAVQIVCGAPNVAAGQTVAVARPGAVMPDGTMLRRAKLRGQESNGMILAEDELAIGTDHDGILVLDTGLEPGTPLRELLPLADDVLTLEITPNRPDCLGIYGVAREVHAATGAPLEPPPWAEDPGSKGDLGEHIRIQVDTDRCPRFTARVFEEVEIGPSPPWLKARLMAAGQRPISNVVDITNYAMLLTGQPLHAFDLDQVAGAELTVRAAHPNERMQTLDGQTRETTPDMVLIADADGPTSIAGVMGGARSEVSTETTRVLMEAATWNGANIHRTSLQLGLRSEASGRFEKGLQPEQAMEAQILATRLMIELCGARVLPGTIDIGGPGPAPPTIRLREARLRSLLGIQIPRERCRAVLEALEFTTTEAEDGLDVIPPRFRRADVTREADVIEEVARLEALERLPATLPSRQAAGRLTARQRLHRAAVDALAAQSLHEVVGWSFTAPGTAERLGLADAPAVRLANPMSAEVSELRTTLLGSLLDIARRNAGQGANILRLFETGAVYRPRAEGELPDEPRHLAALLSGPSSPPSWRSPEPAPADFFAAKGALETLMVALRLAVEVRPGAQPFLHPGRAAEVRLGGEVVGWLGELHPSVAERWELRGTVAGFELDLDRLPVAEVRTYADLMSYPEVREDLAVVVGADVPSGAVLDTVRRAGAPLLTGAEVFDVYADAERIGTDQVSLALRLRYRAGDRTLTDADVAAQRERIVEALAAEHDGRVRGA